MPLPVETPIPIFTDQFGDALQNGYLYFGTPNMDPVTNPVTVYWDEALTIPAQQPIRTSGGYAARNGSPAAVYTLDKFSFLALDSNRRQVFYKANTGFPEFVQDLLDSTTATQARAALGAAASGLATASGLTTAADEVVLGRVRNAGPGPVQEIPFSELPLPRGYIYGLQCSNASGDPTHDIQISPGACRDEGNVANLTANILVKQLDATWTVGSGVGGRFSGVALTPDTTYYLFLIRRLDTGVVDAGFDTDAGASNRPASYGVFRALLSFKTDGSSLIRLFEQNGNGNEREIRYLTPTLDANNVANTSTYINQQLSVPSGKRFKAFGSVVRAGAVAAVAQIRPPSATDGTPSNTASPLGATGVAGATASANNQWTCHTDVNGRVQTATSVAANLYITTEGYREYL